MSDMTSKQAELVLGIVKSCFISLRSVRQFITFSEEKRASLDLQESIVDAIESLRSLGLHLENPQTVELIGLLRELEIVDRQDRKSTRLNSSH